MATLTLFLLCYYRALKDYYLLRITDVGQQCLKKVGFNCGKSLIIVYMYTYSKFYRFKLGEAPISYAER